MATPSRAIPTTYAELSDAIGGGVFPHESAWIDFKRRLYPDSSDKAARDKVNSELAKDMASMAVRGGFLVYGVKENKAKHSFTADEMPLPVGLHETIESVARDRITPPLTVVPTLVPNPATNGTSGFLIVQIPESLDAPHMTEHSYWGRAETGKYRLNDDQVEQLIIARSRYLELLPTEMSATQQVDPVAQNNRQVSHFYFTAVPTRGWPDMFANYSRDPEARIRFLRRAAQVAKDIEKIESGQRSSQIALAGFSKNRRSQRVAAGWLDTWPNEPVEGKGWSLGVDDDGPVRLIILGAGSRRLPSAGRSPQVIHESRLLHFTRDMIRLVAALSDDVSYGGNWLLGVQLDELYGSRSYLSDPSETVGSYQDYDYSAFTKASSLIIHEQTEMLAAALLRRLLRGLGTEFLLGQPPFGQA